MIALKIHLRVVFKGGNPLEKIDFVGFVKDSKSVAGFSPSANFRESD